MVATGLYTAKPLVRVGQMIVTVLRLNKGLHMISVYPTLKGLSYSVHKKPTFSMGVAEASSQREVRVSYANYPIWEWELTYTYLPDAAMQGTTSSDMKEMLGFFLSLRGGVTPFFFLDPDDNLVTNQSLGVGDGTSTAFTFVRTLGGSSGQGIEPIGGLVGAYTPKIYLNGTLQSSGAYTLNTVQPYNNQVVFNTPPAAGVAVTCDIQYYYYVRFKDPTIDLEKFSDKLWQAQKITLRSCKG
jgi:uncharacterized protein (TIGR02217 family)